MKSSKGKGFTWQGVLRIEMQLVTLRIGRDHDGIWGP